MKYIPKKTRPNAWHHQGLDHDKHLAYLRARSQWNFRNEANTLTIEEFIELWRDDLWLCRGRNPEDLCMVRLDNLGAWSRENCVIISRYEQLCRGKRPRRTPGKEFKL
jgi:hypothetical protein